MTRRNHHERCASPLDDSHLDRSGVCPQAPDTRERLLAVAETLARVDVAIEQLTSACRGLHWALPARHDATEAVEHANEKARVARAKLEIVMRRLP